MLEITKSVLPIKIGDKVYNLKSPTYKDSLDYEAAAKECGEDASKKAECLFNYLNILGLPKEEAIDLDINSLMQIIEYVSGVKKK